MGLTLEQVMTLSSIVQKEGNIEEMSMIKSRLPQPLQPEHAHGVLCHHQLLAPGGSRKPIPWLPQLTCKNMPLIPSNTYSNPGLPPDRLIILAP